MIPETCVVPAYAHTARHGDTTDIGILLAYDRLRTLDEPTSESPMLTSPHTRALADTQVIAECMYLADDPAPIQSLDEMLLAREYLRWYP